MSNFHQQRILLVGPGYVGSEVVKVLRENGAEVSSAKRSTANSELEFQADVSSAEDVKKLAENFPSPDLVIHCAASGRGGTLHDYRSVYFHGITNLIQFFPESKLLFTSSTSVYSHDDNSWVSESDACPKSERAQILYDTEKLVTQNKGIVLRLSGIYGPGRSIYLQRLQNGTAEIERREPSRWLNQIHRDDVVSAICHLLQLPSLQTSGETYNVTDGASLTQRECLVQSAKILGLPEPSLEDEASQEKRESNRRRTLTSKRVSNAKLRKTGWQPIFPSFLDALPTLLEPLK